jgi:hypothetical protein
VAQRILALLDGPDAPAVVVPAAQDAFRGGCRHLTIVAVCQADGWFRGAYTAPEQLRETSLTCVRSWLREALALVTGDVAVDCRESVERPTRALWSALQAQEHDLVVVSGAPARWPYRRGLPRVERVCRRQAVPLKVASPPVA